MEIKKGKIQKNRKIETDKISEEKPKGRIFFFSFLKFIGYVYHLKTESDSGVDTVIQNFV